MNPMLQRHCAKFIYIVPDGLRELMSDISREVIRAQPEQLYTYIADYLDALMITRENARIAARLVESIAEIAETTVEILLRIGLSRPEADAIVIVIQEAFRAHLERKKKFERVNEIEGEMDEEELFTHKIMNQITISQEKLEEMAVIIQTAYRKFKKRQDREKQLLFGMVDWRVAARSAIALYRKTGVTKYEANRAATLIKSAYKGYYTRRIMRRLMGKGLDDTTVTSEEADATEETEDLDMETESESIQIPEYLQRIESILGEHRDVIPDYIGLSADAGDQVTQPTGDQVTQATATGEQVTQPTGDAVAEAHESWSPYTEGQVTDEGQTLPIDGELAAEEGSQVDDEHESEVGEMQDDAGGGDMTEVSEGGKLPPPNTEDMSSGAEPTSAPAEADDLPLQGDGDHTSPRDDTVVPTTADADGDADTGRSDPVASDTQASSTGPTSDYTSDEDDVV